VPGVDAVREIAMNLFIYIPTYNRPKAIRAQLAALMPQINRYKDRIRILVSDNASSHGIYDDLRKEFDADNISFRRNPGNIDANANIALGFIFARPDEFLWILSDNDIVAGNAIEHLMLNLEEDIDFFSIHDRVKEEKKVTYYWKDGWVFPVSDGIGLISGLVTNMKSVLPYISFAFYFHNSSFPHLAVVLATARGKGKITLRMVPIVSMSNFMNETETDYGLSRSGMPLLSELMPFDKAKIFAYMWLKATGINFYRQKNGKYNYIFKQSLALLKSYGFKLRAHLFYLSIYYNFLFLKNKLRNSLKKPWGYIKRLNMEISNKDICLNDFLPPIISRAIRYIVRRIVKSTVNHPKQKYHPFESIPKNIQVQWILDVGANLGNAAISALESYAGSKVICFEPVKKNIQIVRAEFSALSRPGYFI